MANGPHVNSVAGLNADDPVLQGSRGGGISADVIWGKIWKGEKKKGENEKKEERGIKKEIRERKRENKK
jgi:hypothetical protein